MANPVVGDTYTAVLIYTDRNNAPLTPQWINLYYRVPVTSQLVEVSWPPVTSSFRQIATNHYEVDIPCSQPGTFRVRAESDLGVMEGEFTVEKSEVL